MCTILDAAEERGVNRGETLKLIMMVQKKIKKGDSIAKIADGLVEDEIVISPIYKMVKEYPEDTERDIYQRVGASCSMALLSQVSTSYPRVPRDSFARTRACFFIIQLSGYPQFMLSTSSLPLHGC